MKDGFYSTRGFHRQRQVELCLCLQNCEEEGREPVYFKVGEAQILPYRFGNAVDAMPVANLAVPSSPADHAIF